MARIDDFSTARLNETASFTPFTGTKPKKNTENRKGERTSPLFFNTLAKETQDAPRLEPENTVASPDGGALTFLLDDVHNAGDALSKRPFPEEIKRYRSAIQKFIRYVVDNAYSVKEDAGIPGSQKAGFSGARRKNDPESRHARNKYSSVQIIDQKLDRLAADIMTGQMKQINLLKNIEEINGLLVDLLE
ncbi:MAG: YaaR family protein [Spirochaetaceae bacterium]|jgi:uncharacterized protein YaaR (DUF327 family)|nr:YaaR family protein [Spirochaetaceae bacterium]